MSVDLSVLSLHNPYTALADMIFFWMEIKELWNILFYHIFKFFYSNEIRFVSTEDKKSQGAKRDNEVLIHRRKEGGLTVPYRIIDNPLKLSPDDW